MSIQLLPEAVQTLLRSGVIVTSPAQTIVELVLNSLDAGATSIAVRVDLKLFTLQVIDNGCGMGFAQLDALGPRYMTSKCHTLDDLQGNLVHYGFRGEALASLREVSGVLLIVSRPQGSNETYCKAFTHGKAQDAAVSSTHRPASGTTITVRDFMYNMHVRRKRICEAIDLEVIRSHIGCIALMHPQVSFSLRDDSKGNMILQKPKCGNLLNSFSHLFGQSIMQSLAPVEYESGKYKITGYISKVAHRQKHVQFIYVNRRVIVRTKLHRLVNALLAKSSILRTNGPWRHRPIPKQVSADRWLAFPSPEKRNKFPVFCLLIECPAKEYDICLDPKKTVIEFEDWPGILKCIEGAIRNFLEKEHLAFESNETVNSSQESQSEINCLNEEKTNSENAQVQSKYEGYDIVDETINIPGIVHGITAKRRNHGGSDAAAGLLAENESHEYSENSKCTTGADNLQNTPIDSVHVSNNNIQQHSKQKHSLTPVNKCISSDSKNSSDIGSAPPIVKFKEKYQHSSFSDLKITKGAYLYKLEETRQRTTVNISEVLQKYDISLVKSKLKHSQVSSECNVPKPNKAVEESTKKDVGNGFQNERSSCDFSSDVTCTVSYQDNMETCITPESLLCIEDSAEMQTEDSVDISVHSCVDTCQNNSTLSSLLGYSESDYNIRRSDSDMDAQSNITCSPEECGSSHASIDTLLRNVGKTFNCETDSQVSDTLSPAASLHEKRFLTTEDFLHPAKCELTSNKCKKYSKQNILDVPQTRNEVLVKRHFKRLPDSGNQGGHSKTLGNCERSQLSIIQNAEMNSCSNKTHAVSSDSFFNKKHVTFSDVIDVTESPYFMAEQRSSTVNNCSSQRSRHVTFEKHPKDVDFPASLLLDDAETTLMDIQSPSVNSNQSSPIFNTDNGTQLSLITNKKTVTDNHVVVIEETSVSDTHSLAVQSDQDKHTQVISETQDKDTNRTTKNITCHSASTMYEFGNSPSLSAVNCDSQMRTEPGRPDDVIVQTGALSYCNNITDRPRFNAEREKLPDNSSQCDTPSAFDTHCINRRVNELSPLQQQYKKDTLKNLKCKIFNKMLSISEIEVISIPSQSSPYFSNKTSASEKVTNSPSNPKDDKTSTSTNSVDNCSDILNVPLTQLTPSQNETKNAGINEVDTLLDLDSSFTRHEEEDPINKCAPSPSKKKTADEICESPYFLFEPVINDGVVNVHSSSLFARKRVSSINLPDEYGKKSNLEEETATANDNAISSAIVSDVVKEGNLSSCNELNSSNRKDSPLVSQHSLQCPQQGADEKQMQERNEENMCDVLEGDSDRTEEWVEMANNEGKIFYLNRRSGITSFNPPVRDVQNSFTMTKRFTFLPKGMSPILDDSVPRVFKGKDDMTPKTRQALHDNILANATSKEDELATVKWKTLSNSKKLACNELVKDLLVSAENNKRYTAKPVPSMCKLTIKMSNSIYQHKFGREIFSNMQVIGQWDNKFIMTVVAYEQHAKPHVIGVFDQHAVHERIRLETLMKDYLEEGSDSHFKSSVIEPHIVLELSSKEYRIMSSFEDKFTCLGLQFQFLNDFNVKITKVPTCLHARDVREHGKGAVLKNFLEILIHEHVDFIIQTRGNEPRVPNVFREVINYEACRGAVKFGDCLLHEECEILLMNLSKCELPFYCAHGRPSFVPIFDLRDLSGLQTKCTADVPLKWLLTV